MNKRLAIAFGLILLVVILVFLQSLNKPGDQKPHIGDALGKAWLDFELPTSTGDIWSSTSIENEAIVLNFWAPWCLPCRKEVPYLIDLQNRYKSNFKFIGIAIDQRAAVRQFEDQVGLNYLSLVDDSKGVNLLRYYEASAILPLTLVFDLDGQLRYRILGSFQPGDLEQALKEIL